MSEARGSWLEGKRLIFLLRIIAFGLLVSGPVKPAKAQAVYQDVYRNMLGDWTGSDDTLKEGVLKHFAVTIAIQEVKEGGAVQMDYVYGMPGDLQYSKVTKFMELKPAKSQMTLHWKGHFQRHEKYKTIGLDEFARKGLGSFTAKGAAVGSGPEPIVFEFTLEPGILVYKWLSETSSGTGVKTTFSMHRPDASAVVP